MGCCANATGKLSRGKTIKIDIATDTPSARIKAKIKSLQPKPAFNPNLHSMKSIIQNQNLMINYNQNMRRLFNP